MSTSDLNHTVTQHPLQDVDLSEPPTNTSPFASNENISPVTTTTTATAATTKNVNKENWVKFDDDVNEGILGTNNNNTKHDNENAGSTATTAVDAASTANRLTPSPLPPPTNAKRNSANVVAAAGPAARPRTPTQLESGPIQQLHVAQLDASTSPVQQQQQQLRSKPSPSSHSIPDVAAPAVLTTESTHVDLNASVKTSPQQQHYQNNNQQHHHYQKSTIPNAANIQQNASASSSSNNVVVANNNNNNSHHNQQPNYSNKLGPLGAGAPTPSSSSSAAASAVANNVTIPVESQPPMRTIELSTGRIREGFANGDVIVTLLPANTKFPWVTPAIFRPELVPEELMAQGLTLTVEEYVHAMETLVNDYRFTMYNICYKRILVCWILFAFTVLLTLLFSGLQGVALFSLGVGWLFLNAAAIFLCMWVKLRLARGLEKCLARVNKQLIKHKILLVLDDRGRISCHKVNLCFLYFDSGPCVSFLNEFLEHTEQNGGETIKAGWESKLDIDLNDIVIQGNTPVRVSRKQAVAQELYLSYLQRWGKDFLRRRLDWTVQEAGVHETPRHLQSSICPCQYEEEVLRNKIKIHLQRKQCCGLNCLGCWM